MQEEYDALLASSAYKEFMTQNPSHRLVNAFILYNEQFQAHWQFGLYSEGSDTITAFTVNGSAEDGFEIAEQPADEVTKEPTAKLLDLDKCCNDF